MAARYSRLAKVEEKKAVRSSVTYIVLTILLLFALLFVGLPGLSKFAGFLIRSINNDTPIDISDNTPPAPPLLDITIEHTNKDSLTIAGSSESGSTVIIKVNGRQKDILADTEGKFSTDVTLNEGENSISAKAIDKSGNESTETKAYTVTVDKEVPSLNIEKPEMGAKFSGKQKQVTIEGTSDIDANITINDRIAIVNGSGKFSQNFTLSDGENTFVVKAKDEAGNEIEESIVVTYTP